MQRIVSDYYSWNKSRNQAATIKIADNDGILRRTYDNVDDRETLAKMIAFLLSMKSYVHAKHFCIRDFVSVKNDLHQVLYFSEISAGLSTR